MARGWGFRSLHKVLQEGPAGRDRLERRRPSPQRFGLALGAGGARGIAHVGVLSVLEEEGIIPDVVVGVSAGALVAALYCYGYSSEQVVALARELRWTRIGRPALRQPLGFLKGERIEQLLELLLDGAHFNDLQTPLAVVSTDLLTGTAVVLKAGPVARAARASGAIPGLFTPVRDGDRLLVDGGMVDRLPVAVVREMGAQYVAAIDVSPLPPRREEPRGLFEMLAMSYYVLLRNSGLRPERPDCLIEPDVADLHWYRFAKGDTLLERGQKAAQAVLSQLERDLSLRV